MYMYHLGLISKHVYNQYKNRLNSVIRRSRNSYYETLFRNNAKNSKKIWANFRSLFGSKGKASRVRELLVGDRVLTHDYDIAYEFNQYFGSVGQNLESNLPMPSSSHIDYMNSPLPNSFYFLLEISLYAF